METEEFKVLASVVGILARKGNKRTPAHVTLDDLTSAGWVGALEAASRFDASKGVKLRTFAEQRVAGAILDYMRREDWVPRSVRSKERQASAVVEQLTRKNGEAPERSAVEAELGWSLDAIGTMQSLDSTHNESETLHEVVPSPRLGHSPEARDQVSVALGALSEGEREVIERIYFLDEKAVDTGVVLGVTESRVSQVRKSAIEKMRVRLAA